jgi:hypothetical protein
MYATSPGLYKLAWEAGRVATARNGVPECAVCRRVWLLPIHLIEMLWIFERKGEQMRCEIRRDGVGAGYEMIVTTPDGSQRMERFDDTTALLKRTLDFQRELLETELRQPKGSPDPPSRN